MVKLRNFKDSDAYLLVLYLNDDNVTKFVTGAISKSYSEDDAQ